MHPIAKTAMRAALVLPFAFATPAAAEPLPCACDAGCAERFQPAAACYDDALHRAWYEDRFWGGACTPALEAALTAHRAAGGADEGPCLSPDSLLARVLGARMAGWWDVMAAALARAPVAGRPALCARLIDVGARLGHEWARANDARAVDSRAMGRALRALDAASDPVEGVAALERLAADAGADGPTCP